MGTASRQPLTMLMTSWERTGQSSDCMSSSSAFSRCEAALLLLLLSVHGATSQMPRLTRRRGDLTCAVHAAVRELHNHDLILCCPSPQFVKRIKSLVSRGASHPKMAALLQVVLGHFQQEQPPQTGAGQPVGHPGHAKPGSGSSTSNADTSLGVSAEILCIALVDASQTSCYTPGSSVKLGLWLAEAWATATPYMGT